MDSSQSNVLHNSRQRIREDGAEHLLLSQTKKQNPEAVTLRFAAVCFLQQISP